MPEPLSWNSGLGMNVTVLPFLPRDVLDHVLEQHQLVAAASSELNL